MHPADRTVWLNALALRPGGSGVQTYIRELISSLSDVDGMRLIAAVQSDAVGELPHAVTTVRRPRSDGVRRALESLRSAAPADLVHGLDVDLPLRNQVPTVTTVHDMSVFDVPWAYSRTRATAERALVRRALRTADEVLCVSAFTAERVAAISGRSGTVTHLAPARWASPATAAEIDAVRDRYRLPRVFVLQVASVEPRKSVALLESAADAAGIPVVLAGSGSGARTRAGKVVGLGYVDRADLPALYGAATVVAYLSEYEGFGLPPLEAMACGAPVVASNTGPMPEVLRTGAILVGRQLDAVAAVLRRLVDDVAERAALVDAGRRVASGYSWQTTAAGTAEVYRRCWGGR